MSYYGKPIVLMFLGVPGSGKSYFARKVAKELNAVRVNGDSMRLAMFGSLGEIERIYQTKDRRVLNEYVFNGLYYVAEQILTKGYDVVYDAHQNKRMDRKSVEDIAERQGALAVVVRINTPHDVAFERTQSREATIDQRKMTPEKAHEVIERHKAHTDNPETSEIVIDLDGLQSFEQQFAEFDKHMRETLAHVG